jgi:N-acetylneuraminic acid mutarotase
MRYSHTHFVVLALLGLTLAACTEDATTQPSTPEVSEPSALAATATSGQWVTRADMPNSGRLGLATAMIPNSSGQSVLYAIGGKTATGGSLSRVQAYNVATNSWSWKSSMPIPVYMSNGAGVINGKIYISGGFTSYSGLNYSFYRYDPATNTWTRRSDPPGTSYGGVTGVINNKLYVATQCEQEDCFEYGRFLYRYDPATDQWTTLAPPPPYEVGLHAGGTIGGRLYVTGGGNKVAVYDPATDHWTLRTTSNQVESVNAGTTFGAKLYVFGTTTSVYDTATNAWTKLASPPSYRSGRSATRVVLNGKARIELVGGASPGNNLAFIP